MPTYEYACSKCGKNFEVFQSMKDDPLKICTKELCRRKTWGKGKVKRLLGTGAGIIFKGSGFYATDYRSEGYKSAAKKDSESANAKPAATESKSSPSEAKTTAKPEKATKAKSS